MRSRIRNPAENSLIRLTHFMDLQLEQTRDYQGCGYTYANLDPSFLFNADHDPNFHFNDLDPAPQQSLASLRSWSTDLTRLNFEPPHSFRVSMAIHGHPCLHFKPLAPKF